MNSIEDRLRAWADKYECSAFIKNDPIQFPHRYSSKQDIEISAFLTAWISYGNRKCIVKKAEELDVMMGHSPYDFIRVGGFLSWKDDQRSFYRFYKYSDLYALCSRLQTIYVQNEDLETALLNLIEMDPISKLQMLFAGIKGIPVLNSNSACKRLCMFLRWMIRQNSPVDIGVWKNISPSCLLIPLDVHVYNKAIELGHTKRRSQDRKTAEEITSCFDLLFPGDPARGDFALFGEDINHTSQ
ncbi:MAG TPA: TIGR02757 family protein [Paludibacteraceae bacterium]|jgi:uncharacterized protein (TIGR02757 family)|nr:TIGR02757 family protein [Paludibacteraceae bacterium]